MTMDKWWTSNPMTKNRMAEMRKMFDDSCIYGCGIAEVTADGISHVPYRSFSELTVPSIAEKAVDAAWERREP